MTRRPRWGYRRAVVLTPVLCALCARRPGRFGHGGIRLGPLRLSEWWRAWLGRLVQQGRVLGQWRWPLLVELGALLQDGRRLLRLLVCLIRLLLPLLLLLLLLLEASELIRL